MARSTQRGNWWKLPQPRDRQADYDLHEYQCYDKIYIPGTSPSYRSNRVIVNGNEIKMADYLFLLFFRFVAELKKGNGGWVNIHSLAEEGIISDVQKYQIYGNLRAAIQGCLLGKDGRKFIQSNGSKNYRISTHPDLVGCDKEKLLRHSSHTVRQLAGELL